jgi:hypothetical protein
MCGLRVPRRYGGYRKKVPAETTRRRERHPRVSFEIYTRGLFLSKKYSRSTSERTRERGKHMIRRTQYYGPEGRTGAGAAGGGRSVEGVL